MEYRPLGRSGLTVSAICLGTMTFGEQNSENEGHALMDLAADHGINFFDAAEMYPISPRAETHGRTEEIIGTWMRSRSNRDKVIVATKVVGRDPTLPWLRGAGHCLDRKNILAAAESSLRRLQTEVIDLYYLHWPDRNTNCFGNLGYRHDPNDDFPPLEESLSALDELVKAGKIRHIGLSNETPWGLHTFLMLSESKGLPRVQAVQNPYSLLNRTYEIGLAEMSIREDVPLIAYSPLGGGALTGKYAGGARPAGSRVALWPERYGRYIKPRGVAATVDYVAVAREHGLEPAQMALAYTLRQPFLASSIVGATSIEQLRLNLGAADLTLDDAVLAEIEKIHASNPNPSP